MKMNVMPAGLDRLDFSFEFFPPKTEAGWRGIPRAAAAFRPLDPEFCSVTYGAGGSNQTGTLDAVLSVQEASGSPGAAHLTAAGQSREAVEAVARTFLDNGIGRIVALRGDSRDEGPYRPHPEGYANAAELVAGLKKIHDFDISVAAYPEKHPDSPTPEADLENLKAKLDAGADRAITQFFFDADSFLRYRDRLAAAGVYKPVIPGVLPIRDIEQVQRFAAQCEAVVPPMVVAAYDGLDRIEDRHKRSVDLAHELCARLVRHGVRSFHFYTLNKSDLTVEICKRLAGTAESEAAVAAASAAR